MKSEAVIRVLQTIIAGALPGLLVLALPSGRSRHADLDMSFLFLPLVAAALAGGIPGCISLFEGARGGVVRALSAGLVAAIFGVVAWLFSALVLMLVLWPIGDGIPSEVALWVGNAGIVGWASAMAVVTVRGIFGMSQFAVPKALCVSGALGGLVAGSVSLMINSAFGLVWSHMTSLFLEAMLLGACVSVALAIADLRAEKWMRNQETQTL